VGDSILGNGAHLGAGVICSNLRLDQADVLVTLQDDVKYSTKLRKLGALVGDQAEVGCNAVLNPGSILGKRALVMPTIAFRGTVAENSLAYQKEPILSAPRMD
jgi:NDP-sugar pyrophosphorylase family protein